MSQLVICKENYILFDGYQLNTEKAINRYEYISDKPIKTALRDSGKNQCRCGGMLVPLAYVFDDGNIRSMTLIGRKCSCCGQNYFTEKTINKCDCAFEIENVSSKVAVDLSENSGYIRQIKRGDIYYADLTGLENYCGAEQTGKRPVLIIQNDKANYFSRTAVIATITSKIKKKYPTHVLLKKGILKKKSVICLEQLKTIDKQRLERYVTSLDEEIMQRVNRAIIASLGL